MTKKKRKKAVGIRYRPSEDKAPKLIAKGAGLLAERIIEIAKEHGVPIREDKDLVEVLSLLDLYQEIPPETYVIVAEILAWIYGLDKKIGHG